MSRIVVWVNAHRKLAVAVVGTLLTVAIQIWGTNNPYVSLAVLAATSLGVYGAPNIDPPDETRPSITIPGQNPASGTVRVISEPAAGTTGPAPSGAAQ